MRLLELRPVDDPHVRLTLHPRLTVVAGLAPAVRARLVASIAALFAGDARAVVAVVETDDGTVVEVSPAGVLPAGGPADGAVLGADAVLAALAAAPAAGPAPDELAQARRRHATSRATLDALDRALALVQAEHRGALLAHDEAVGAIDAAYASLDVHAWPALDAALADAQRAEEAAALPPGSVAGPSAEAVHARLDQVLDEHSRLGAAMTRVRPPDNARLRDAYDLWRIASGRERVPSPEAAALAEEWIALRETVAERERDTCQDPDGLTGLENRLDAARGRLRAAGEALTPRPPTPDEVAELERAHDAVVEAEQRLNSRFGGSKARRAFDEAVERERELLERLGYLTWAAYVMGERVNDSVADRKQRYATARKEVERLEREHARVRRSLERDPVFSAAMARLQELHRQVVALVGEVDDVPGALRAVPLTEAELPVSPATARAILVEELHTARGASDGVAGHASGGAPGRAPDEGALDEGALDDDSLAAAVEAELGEAQGAQALHRLLDAARDQCAAELAKVGELLSAVEAGPGLAGREALADPLRDLADSVALARTRVSRHRAALLDITVLLDHVADLARAETDLRAQVEAKQELFEVTARMEAAHAATLNRLLAGGDRDAAAVAARLDEAVAPAAFVVVLDDALGGLAPADLAAVLAWVDALAARTQVLVLDDRAELVTWARLLGERAEVVDAATAGV